LAINTPDGLIIVVGCSHPGIDKIAELATTVNPHIHFIVGGFHLVVAPDPEVDRIATILQDRFKVDYIAPGHCTGEPAFTAAEGFRRSLRLCGPGTNSEADCLSGGGHGKIDGGRA
jgi:7,8-dihydropterin-6-yl-methyl-4-(beta-D-ribofuranosyl)aminobenzene 5'-phosphate synthase